MERTRQFLTLIAFVGLILSAPALFAAAAAPPGPSYGGPCTVHGSPPQLDPPHCDYNTYGPIKHGPGLNQAELQDGIHRDFANRQQGPGGILHGTVNTFTSKMDFNLVGINELEGYERKITLEVDCEAHAGPWSPDESVISFDTHMVRLEGSLENDPDFESFRIIGGLDNGYESPGHQTAIRQDDGSYVLDSMFEIGFRVEYVGAAGGAFEGHAGSSEGTATVKAFAAAER